MPDENTTTTVHATQPAPAPAEHVKPNTEQPAPATATVESSGTRPSPAITRAPTRVARGVTRSGAPHTAAAARPAKPAAAASKIGRARQSQSPRLSQIEAQRGGRDRRRSQ